MHKEMSNDKPKDLFLLQGISHLVFNKDYTQCALSKKDNNIYIYQVPNIMDTSTWQLTHTLTNHFHYISGIDWHPITNRIVSCSHDKTTLVWKYENNQWDFDVVVATVKVSYLFCSWNARGDKFVEGTGNKLFFIGYYSQEKKWWTALPNKNHRGASIRCAKIEPSSLFVISGSADLVVYISSCYIKELDDPNLTEDQKLCVQPFGTAIHKFEAGGWAIACNWSLDGDYAYISSQNGIIDVIDWKKGTDTIIQLNHSPVTYIIPNSEHSFYAIGYDRQVYLYEETGGKWVLKKIIIETGKKEDSKGNKISVGGMSNEASGGVAEALSKMHAKDNNKKASIIITTQQTDVLHATNISSATIKGSDLITSDLAGFVKYWKL